MSRGLVLSVALHVATILAILVAPTSRAGRWEPLDAIEVDLVPQSRPEPELSPRVEPPPPAPELEPEPEEVVEAEPEPQKPQVRRAPARRIQRIAPRRDEPTLEERIKQRLSDVEPEPEPEPPRPVSEPPSPSRTEVQAQDFPYAWYLNVLRTRITDSWDPPGERMLEGRGNRVTISFRIHRDGHVTDVRVDGASGTPGLDASARRAVDLAQPLPPLPAAYDGEFLEVAVRFTVGGAS